MSYAEFLFQWYNLPFVGAVLGTGVLSLARRRRGGSAWSSALFIVGICGLTMNGAIHDLALGSPAARFPLVLAFAMASGGGLVFLGRRIRQRMFPPVTGVTWNRRGLDGSAAQIVTPTGGPDSPFGRARVRDEAGVSHVVRVHSEGPALRFGRRIRLGVFDEPTDSYPVEAV